MEIVKIEKVKITNEENNKWVDFYDMIEKICKNSTDNDLNNACIKILNALEEFEPFFKEEDE